MILPLRLPLCNKKRNTQNHIPFPAKDLSFRARNTYATLPVLVEEDTSKRGGQAMSGHAAEADLCFTDSPTYWFVLLESARLSGDFERAAEAKRELERLGVLVTYRPVRGPRRGGPGHAA